MSLAENLSKAINKLQINNVYLSAVDIKLLSHPMGVTPETIEIDSAEKIYWKLNKSEDLLICHVHRTLKGFNLKKEGEDVPKEVLHIEVMFLVQYSVNDPEKTISDHTYKVFSETNAVYNSYPYFREYIHSSCARMGIPPLILPFLKPLTMKEILERFPVEEDKPKVDDLI